MMEGISSEAASFAGHQRLSNLCWIYDSNRVTIEGHTDITFTEDVAARFIAYGWNVTTVADANDLDAVERAFHTFKAEHERPTLILVHSHIGYGSPVEDSPKAHGEPFGVGGRQGDEAVPRPARGHRLLRPRRRVRPVRRTASARAAARPATAWEAMLRGVPRRVPRARRRDRAHAAPRTARRLGRRAADVPGRRQGHREPRLVRPGAERARAGGARGCWAARPTSRRRPRRTSTFDGAGDFQPDDRGGRNLHFGIREHASAAIANGMALTKLRPYWSGFLIFSDYARGAIRLSALMEIPILHIFTHDSIGVGEDGPTHQPVEQLASLRAMPGLLVFRPADANEVVETWRIVAALRRRAGGARPVAPGPADPRPLDGRPGVRRRQGRVRARRAPTASPDVILLATGSEVALALAARDELAADGHRRPRREHAVLGAVRPSAKEYRDRCCRPR